MNGWMMLDTTLVVRMLANKMYYNINIPFVNRAAVGSGNMWFNQDMKMTGTGEKRE